MQDRCMTSEVEQYWDAQAATFDDEADHGLRDATVRSAWADLLLPLLPLPPSSVVDLGCGTGSLSVLLAEAGHTVRGLDLSSRMIAAAAEKAKRAAVPADFRQGDAADPPYAPGSCDVVLARHVLWALPDPAAALRRWTALLRPEGRMVLIEGRWWTGGGLTAVQCKALVLSQRRHAEVHRLDDERLWGHHIDDERYVIVSRT